MHFHRGVAAQLLGQLEAAERDYRQALALAPAMMAAHENLGQVLARRGELAAAAASYRRALACQPELRGYLALASLEQKRGDAGAAEEVYRDALARHPA
jgi:Tfp pilus assembly protein PilF